MDLAVERGEIVPLPDGTIEPGQTVWEQRRQARRERVADAAKTEARRRRAKLKLARANMRLLRRKAAKMQADSIDRKKARDRLGAIISALFTQLDAINGTGDPVMAAARAHILADLGSLEDLVAEMDTRVFGSLGVAAKAPADRDD